MWNIRSHACRFPVHTGTLTPSIAHPNRFLNHLKRFSAGFLTFRGGKIKKRMVLGAESTIWNARRACFRWKRRCGGKGLRMRWNPLSHALRRASSPEGGAFRYLAVSRAKPPPSGEVASRSDDGEGSRREKLPQSSRFARCQTPPFVTFGDIFPRSGGSRPLGWGP